MVLVWGKYGLLVLFLVTGVRLTLQAILTAEKVLVSGVASGLGHFCVSDVDKAWWMPGSVTMTDQTRCFPSAVHFYSNRILWFLESMISFSSRS